MDYKLPLNVQGQSRDLTTSMLSLLLISVPIAIIAFVFYRRRVHKGTVALEKKESREQEKKTIPETMLETKPETTEIRITGEMKKVIDTLSDKEKAIVGLLLRNGGSATRAGIRYETVTPKSLLTGIINALKRKNIIKKRKYGKTNVIELS